MLKQGFLKEKWNSIPSRAKPYMLLVLTGILLRSPVFSVGDRYFLLCLVALLCYTAVLPVFFLKGSHSKGRKVWFLICAIVFPAIGVLGIYVVVKVWHLTTW